MTTLRISGLQEYLQKNNVNEIMCGSGDDAKTAGNIEEGGISAALLAKDELFIPWSKAE